MTDIDRLIRGHSSRLKKALDHLRYSSKKVRLLPVDPSKLDEEELGVWESFSTRFMRAVDLFLTKYLRSVVLKNDPGFEGSLRDFVNQGEKLGLVDNADRWMALRELRNITAHEYTDEELSEYFAEIRKLVEHVLRIEKILDKPPKK